jgi:tetratricopeptide (TPR) repeat protein
MLAALTLPPRPAAATEEAFPLTRAIPEDVFLVVAERYNPEQQFLRDHWATVWKEFQNSRIAPDLLALFLSAVPEEGRATLEQVWSRLREHTERVDWETLGKADFAFAERIARFGGGPQGQLAVMPEYLVLLRSDAKTARRAFEGLSGLFVVAAEEIRRATGHSPTVLEEELGTVRTFGLELAGNKPGIPRFPLFLGCKDEVLFLTFGAPMHDQVVALLSGSDDVRPVATMPRFRASFADLPAPEDGFQYVDFVNLRGELRQVFDGVFSTVEKSGIRDRILNADRNPEATAVRSEGFAHYQEGEFHEALRLTEASLKIDPGDSKSLYNIACLHALLGHPDQAFEWLDRAIEAGFQAPGAIRHESDFISIQGDPRLAAAIERAEKLAAGAGGEWVKLARKVFDRTLDFFRVADTVTTVNFTEGTSTIHESSVRLAPGAAKMPLYAVLTGGKPLPDLTRMLPEETVSFSASGGLDLDALCAYLEGTVRELGPLGEQLWSRWEKIQEEVGVDVRHDLLGWIEGATIQATFEQEGASDWVWMMRVKNEQTADRLLGQAVELVPPTMQRLVAKAPPLALVSPRFQPCSDPALEGFQKLWIGMMQRPLVLGVHKGWLWVGSRDEAVRLVLATDAGEHPALRENDVLMARAQWPDGPATAISFRDHRGDAEEAAGIVTFLSGTAGMAAMAIPDPQVRELATGVCELLTRLGPVVRKIDFYRSTSSWTTFDGERWHTRKVIRYAPAPAKESIDRWVVAPTPPGEELAALRDD